MTLWLRAVEIKQLLEVDADFEEIREGVSGVLINDGDPEIRVLGEQLEAAENEAEFDDALGDLYDYADLNRIWVGETGDSARIAKGVRKRKAELKELFGSFWKRRWDYESAPRY